MMTECTNIAERWFQAIAHTAYLPIGREAVNHKLAGLVYRAIAILRGDVAVDDAAEAIGCDLARIRFLGAKSLGKTQQFLTLELGTLAKELDAEEHCLTLLISGLTVGFVQQTSRTLLREQEEIRSALVGELSEREKELSKARDELEWRVRQRTSELARTNRELLIEISERERAEEALRESEEKWRTLVHNLPDEVIMLNRDGTIQFMNHVPAGSTVTTDAVLGTQAAGWALPEYHELVSEKVRAVFRTGTSQSYEAAAHSARGSVRWYSAVLSPLVRGQEVVAAIQVTRDITDRKEIESIKDNLIRDVSHELRTPLAKMKMGLELLLEILEKDPIDRVRAANVGGMVSGNVDRLLLTVKEILDLSAIEAGRLAFTAESINVSSIIREAVCFMMPMARAKGLELEAQLHPDLLPVWGDREQLTRVLINLVDNAIKFSDSGEIVISVDPNGNQVEISVQDSGCGIRTDNLHKIFDRFFQERSRYHGSGVGLTICRHIVEAHGGNIWAESEGRGKGARIVFVLPTQGES